MHLTFIVTIDPVKELALLKASIHSLNLQTRKSFDVIFHNQTLLDEEEIFGRLRIRPDFSYTFASVARENFLGTFPLWDLYAVHSAALEADAVGDYFMSVHMEEFFDTDYVEKATEVLDATRFDVLLGNLCRTSLDESAIDGLVAMRTSAEFEEWLRRNELKSASHWTFHPRSDSVLRRARNVIKNASTFWNLGLRTRLTPTESGYTKLNTYREDLYFMRKDFARRYDWFLAGKRMYFEDVQLCQKAGVGAELAKLTAFPLYLNSSRVYHLKHRRFYFQLEDPTFTDGVLRLRTEDPLLRTLQQAIEMYRAGRLTREEALQYTRQNPAGTGTQNLNYRYHVEAIKKAQGTS